MVDQELSIQSVNRCLSRTQSFTSSFLWNISENGVGFLGKSNLQMEGVKVLKKLFSVSLRTSEKLNTFEGLTEKRDNFNKRVSEAFQVSFSPKNTFDSISAHPRFQTSQPPTEALFENEASISNSGPIAFSENHKTETHNLENFVSSTVISDRYEERRFGIQYEQSTSSNGYKYGDYNDQTPIVENATLNSSNQVWLSDKFSSIHWKSSYFSNMNYDPANLTSCRTAKDFRQTVDLLQARFSRRLFKNIPISFSFSRAGRQNYPQHYYFEYLDPKIFPSDTFQLLKSLRNNYIRNDPEDSRKLNFLPNFYKYRDLLNRIDDDHCSTESSSVSSIAVNSSDRNSDTNSNGNISDSQDSRDQQDSFDHFDSYSHHDYGDQNSVVDSYRSFDEDLSNDQEY
jgi:hypothetical protein